VGWWAGPRRAGRAGRARPWGLLALACAAVGTVAFLVTRAVPLGWDEIIYVTQVDPRHPAAAFGAPRARGISLLVAPVVWLTGSAPALRGYLAALSAVFLVAAYGTWVALRRDVVPAVAAALFGSLWVALFYLPAAMPNIAVAGGAVAATGCLLLVTGGRRGPWPAAGLAGSVVLACLVRPSDGLVLGGALGAAVLAVPAWRRLRTLVLLGAALVVGWLPWVVEAQIRYGGVLPRLRRAVTAQGTDQKFAVDLLLRTLDGPILCRPCVRADHPIPLDGVLWWAAAAALVVVAVAAARPGERARTVLPTWVAACLAGSYLPLGYAAPRFLLPAYAVAALPAAEGLVWLLRRPRAPATRRLVGAAVLTALAAHVAVQVSTVRAVARANSSRTGWVADAHALQQAGVRPPCLLVGPNAVPVAYSAGCASARINTRPGEELFTPADVARAQLRGAVAVVQNRRDLPPPWAEGWRRIGLPNGWVGYVARGPARGR
jgi:hypothetical protein